MDMNVKIVVGIDASRNRSGGARAHLIGIIENFDPELYGVREVHVWSYQDLLDALPERAWLRKHSPHALGQGLLAQLIWQRFELDKEAKKNGCDIMFATSASTLSKFSPMVVLSQDMLSYEDGVMSYFGLSKARLRLLLILWLQNAAFRRAEGVMFLTRYAAKVIQQSCGALSNIAYVPHGVGDSFRNIGMRRKWPVAGEPIVCTYVSSAEMYKHQWFVVEAIAILRKQGHNLRLILIGGGQGKAQKLLTESVRRFDPTGTFVSQIKFVSQQELQSHLSKSNIFIFASSCENLPVTLLEGMAAGLPIACSDRGPMPEVLEDSGIYFDPENPSSIARAIEQLLVDPNGREQLADRARRLAESYSWRECADATFKFIVDTYWNGKLRQKSWAPDKIC